MKFAPGGKTCSWCALVPVLLYGLFLRAHGLGDHWGKGFLGYGAYYANIARNYIRYGYVTTKLAPVVDVGPVSPDHFSYYLHHPPLFGLLISLSFRIFGIHEWSARLVPLLFSVGCLVVLYLIARNIWDRRSALLATFFMSVMPMAAFFGPHVDVQGSVLLFWVLLTFYFYLLWVDKERTGFFAGFIAAFAAGALTDWPAFFLVPLLGIHFSIYGSRRRRRQFLLFVLVAVLLFISLAAYLGVVAEDYRALFKEMIWKTSAHAIDLPESQEQFTLRQWFRQIGGYYWNLFTPVPLILSALWLTWFLPRRRTDFHRNFLALLILLFGLLHVVLFRQGAFVHDYWSAYLSPGLALGSALAVGSLVEKWKARPAVWLALACGGLAFALSSTARVFELRERFRDDSYYELGKVVREHTRFSEGVLTCLQAEDPGMWFYPDRTLRDKVTSPEILMDYLDEPGANYRYFIMLSDDDQRYPDLAGYLHDTFRALKKDRYLLFDLSSRLAGNERRKLLDTRFSFLQRFAAGKIFPQKRGFETPSGRPVFIHGFERGGVWRDAVVTLAGSGIEFTVPELRGDESLLFSIAMPFDVGDGSEGRIILRTKNAEKVLFSEYVNPSGDPGARGWLDRRVSLPAIREDQAVLIFECAWPRNGDVAGDWFAWGNPRIVGALRPEGDVQGSGAGSLKPRT